MGRRREKVSTGSQTLPPSPSHSFSSSSSSSSDFEFAISESPCNKSSSTLCPPTRSSTRGQLLPLRLSPRVSMVRKLHLYSSSTSSSSTTTASCDSTGCASSQESKSSFSSGLVLLPEREFKKNKFFSLPRFSSVFKKESSNSRGLDHNTTTSSSVKSMRTTVKAVIGKYLKKVKPLSEILSQKNQQKAERSVRDIDISSKKYSVKETSGRFPNSFSGIFRYPRRRSCVSSCPSSMRSSPPCHSGILSRSGFSGMSGGNTGAISPSNSSTVEELQCAIQDAVAHCKNSMNKSLVSNEI